MSNTEVSINKKKRVSNLKTLKERLMDPKKFLKEEHTDFNKLEDKACFSFEYKKYGWLETWDMVLDKINNLPENQNVFNELLLENTKVKPYLDIEWYQKDFPGYMQDEVLLTIKKNLLEIFKEKWIDIQNKDIYCGKCHRDTTAKGYKYSFRVVISADDEGAILCFKNTNQASLIAKLLREKLEKEGKFSKEIIDISVYKKTQNIRMMGQCKPGEYIPFEKIDNEEDSKYIISYIGPNYLLLTSEEQENEVIKYKNINKTIEYTNELIEFIKSKIIKYHPTVYFEAIKGYFLHFNYKNRYEPCFYNEDITHDSLGVFAYVYNNDIYLGCRSGRCQNENEKQYVIVIGSLTELHIKDKINEDNIEKLHPENFITIGVDYIVEQINSEAKGIANLLKLMYAQPRRIINTVNFEKNRESYYWNGDIWKLDSSGYISSTCQNVILNILKYYNKVYESNTDITITDTIKNNLKNCYLLQKKVNNLDIITKAITISRHDFTDEYFDANKDIHPYFLSCHNGLVDLRTGEIRKRKYKDLITHCLETSYNPEADSSEFETFVKQITSYKDKLNIIKEDKELYNYLRWMVGYSIQGKPSKKAFFILYGKYGFNGKSLFINTIKTVLQEGYAVEMDPSVVFKAPEKTSGSTSSQLCALYNIRLGVIGDTKETDIINDGLMKKITGLTDTISTREIYKKQITFKPTFVPIINANHMIKLNLNDEAMYRRLNVINFSLSFVDNPTKPYEIKNNPDLDVNLKENKEGILKWIIDAGIYYNNNKDLQPPKKMEKLKKDWKLELDDCACFLHRDYIQIPKTAHLEDKLNSKILRNELLDCYKEYCKQNLIKKPMTKLLDNLKSHLIEERIDDKIYFIGIKKIYNNESDDEF